jgi:hypothetical protein
VLVIAALVLSRMTAVRSIDAAERSIKDAVVQSEPVPGE